MKIPELKRSRIRIIAEFRGIPLGLPNQDAEQGNKDAFVGVGAVDDAEQEQGGVVSPTLTFFMLYEFIYSPNSFII